MKKFLGAVLVVALFIGVDPTLDQSAKATELNPSLTSNGYIYYANSTNNGIERFDVRNGRAETIPLTSASCAALDKNSIYEITPDPVTYKLYYTNFVKNVSWSPNVRRAQVNELDLKTGECRSLVSTTYTWIDSTTSNGESYTGLALDSQNRRLYYMNNDGGKSIEANAWQNKNRSLAYVDLSDGTNHIIEITNTHSQSTIAFPNDVILDGDYVYTVGKTIPNVNGIGNSDSVFRFRVTQNGSVLASTESEVLYTFGPPTQNASNSRDLMQIGKFGNEIYVQSSIRSAYSGIYKFDLSDPAGTQGVALISSWAPPQPTGTQQWAGFAFGENGELFSYDSPDSNWGPAIFWKTAAGQNAVALSGDARPNPQFGNLNYSAAQLPPVPTINQATQGADTTRATITFTPPVGADPDGEYVWVAKPTSGSEVTGTCSASPCSVTGLAAGVSYTFTLSHNFKNSNGDVIIRGKSSASVTPTLGSSSVSSEFAGFKTMSSKLSASQKTAIRTWVNANSSMTRVSCVGQVGYNWANVSRAELRALARNRANAVCNYIKAVRPAITITGTTIRILDSKQSGVRKVTVTLR